jgi:endonuclease/exonuclease/phosphatase family metal-dependent hydrolase
MKNFEPLSRRRFLCRALFVLTLLGTAARLPAAEPKAGAAKPAVEIRIVSYNMLGGDGTGGTGPNAWATRRDLVAELLRNQKPDVIDLQKAARISLDDLHQALPGYGEVGVGRNDGKTGGEYAAILYRTDRFDADESGTFWLSETPNVAGSTGWGARQARVCTWVRLIEKSSKSAFYVFTTHLDPTSATVRDNCAILIQNRIKVRTHPDPFILAGDMNSPESSTTIRIFKGPTDLTPEAAAMMSPPPLLDTFRVRNPDETGVSTRHQFTGSRNGEKVDYILAPATIEVVAAEILRDQINGKYPSDHFPVAATLRIPISRP